MKKSKVETVETRRKLVDTASKLLLSRGLASTSIGDVMSAGGMTQGGFYRHFASKEKLVAEANDAASAQLQAALAAAALDKSPRAALDAVVALYLDPAGELSALCSLAGLGSELRHADGEIRSVVMQGHARMVDFIAGRLQALGVPDHGGVASAMVSTMVGAVTIARLAVEPATAQAILDNARKLVTAHNKD